MHILHNSVKDLTEFILLPSLQVIFMASYMIASYASSNLSGNYASVDGVSISNAFIGGFLLLFGARFASGCTRYFICKLIP